MAKGEKLVLKDLDKILEQDSLKIISELSSEIKPIMELVKTTKNKSLKISMINYLVIRLVSTLESYYRNLVRELIDSELFDAKGLLANDELTISLLELDSIKQNSKITKGRIIVSNMNFQNLDKINDVISQILGGEKFFTRLNKDVDEFEKMRKIRMLSSSSKRKRTRKRDNTKIFDWQEFRDLVENRHKIIHNMIANKKISLDEISNNFNYLFSLIMFTESEVVKELMTRLKNDLNPQLVIKLKERMARPQKIYDSISLTVDTKVKKKKRHSK